MPEWEALAVRLLLIDGYPEKYADELRKESSKQLQRICKGDDQLTPIQQANILVTEAIATKTWKGFGWPGMKALFDVLFKEEEPEFDLKAPKPGDCPKCGTSGIVKSSDNLSVRCSCVRGKLITDESLALWNQPMPEIKLTQPNLKRLQENIKNGRSK